MWAKDRWSDRRRWFLCKNGPQAEVRNPKRICPDRPRRKVPMSRPSQTQSAYVQTIPDGKCLCPDRPRLKVPMSRPSQTESGYVQTIVSSKLFVRSSCVRKQLCPDHPRPKRYMSRLSCVLVQTIVRSKSNSCVQRQNFSASMSTPSCVHVQNFVRSPDPNKITSCCAVLFLEDEDREGSKIPQIHIFKVYKKMFLNHFFCTIERKIARTWPRLLKSCCNLFSNYTCILLSFWNLVVIYFQIILAFCICLIFCPFTTFLSTRTMVWTWPHDGLDMNARKSGHERRKIFRAFMSRLSCVHVQTIVRSPDHCAFMSRPSCVHVQTIMRSSVFPDRVILNARHPLRAFWSGTSAWVWLSWRGQMPPLQLFSFWNKWPFFSSKYLIWL